MKCGIKILALLLLLFLTSFELFGQSAPSAYYNVINKDSLYIFSSDTNILFFSSPSEFGNFSYLSNIEGDFTSYTNTALNNAYFIIENRDTLFLYDISDIHHPGLLSTISFEFTIDQIYRFGPYFILKTANTLKLLGINNNSLEIIEDTLIVLNNQPLFKYPYIIVRRNIYKYVEGFGAFQIYFMDHAGDGGMEFQFIAEDNVVYTTLVYRPPPLPPSVCGIRARVLQEPDFPIVLINDWWADCLPAYVYEYYGGSKRYIYLLDVRIPPNGGRIVVNFSGITRYQQLSWEYVLKLTDVYLFQLGDNILYSLPGSPSMFHELEYSITSVNENDSPASNYSLKNNYPNPFNPSTTIEYSIPEYSYVSITVTDLLGEKVAVLVDGEEAAGNYRVKFNGTSLPSGIYFYTLKAGTQVISKKMVLMR